ncbi:MAG: iron ABC transporter permease [Anaerolineae bacterium]|nr:iron ABC transporter permease [Anaerolineae bacterium]
MSTLVRRLGGHRVPLRPRFSGVGLAAIAGLCLTIWLPLGVMVWGGLMGGHLPRLDARFWSLTLRTLVVAGGSAGLATLLGLPVGIALGRLRLPGNTLLRALQVTPLLVPSYVSAIGWLHLLGRSGPLNRWLVGVLALEQPPLDAYSVWGAIWILGLAAFPLVALPVLAGLDGIDPDLEEEALLLGSRWDALRYVTMPLILPVLLGGALLAFLAGLAEFAVPSFLSVNVYTVEVFARFAAFYDFAAGAAAALPLLMIALAAFAGERWLAGRRPRVGLDVPYGAPRGTDPGLWRAPAIVACMVPVVLAVAVPLLSLASRAPSFSDYRFAWEVACREVANSLLFAPCAATVALVVALPIAWSIARVTLPGTSPLVEAASLLPVALPGMLLGIGLIRIWNRAGPFLWVYRSPCIVILGQVARALPFAVLCLAACWRQVPVALEESARIAGASSAQVLWRILLPLLRPGLRAGWCLGLVAAMAELQTTLLVYPPGAATLPARIFTLQHDGQAENVAALCMILTAITVLPAAAAWALGRREEEQP